MSKATEMLEKYYTAEAALLEGKEVRLGERSLKMEDLPSIIAGRKEWEQRVAAEEAAARRAPSIGGTTFKLANFSGSGQ